ncbi:hypothetical protein BVRB_025140, partial [Beta vulgaris subsp. vulgaris]
NQESTSDLTLVVNGSHYHGHKAIVAHCSEMVAGMLRSNLIEQMESKAVLRINPPLVSLPSFTECDRLERELNGESLFELYLLIIYGLKNPATLTVKELCSVAVLANFMLSSKIAFVCEKLIVQKLWLSQDSWQDAFRFANRHGFALLSKCILDYAAMLVHRSECIEDLLCLDLPDILQILRVMRLSAKEQFRLLICYLAYQSCKSISVLEQFDSCWNSSSVENLSIYIEGDERVDFFKQATKLLAPTWNDRELLCKIKLLADCVVMRTSTGQITKDNFLYSAILDQLMILMR